MNSSWADTVQCQLDASKSPIFRSQNPCTYIYIRTGVATVLGFRTYIYTYERVKLSVIVNLLICLAQSFALLVLPIMLSEEH